MERAVGAVCFDRAEWMEQTVEATTEILALRLRSGQNDKRERHAWGTQL